MTDRFKLGIEAAAKEIEAKLLPVLSFDANGKTYWWKQHREVLEEVLAIVRALPIPDSGEVVELDREELAHRALLFREGSRRFYDDKSRATHGDMWFFELFHFLADVNKALAASPAPVAGDWMKEAANEIGGIETDGTPAFNERGIRLVASIIARHAPPASDALVESDAFDYFECPECGFDSVLYFDPANNNDSCPLCAGDSGHDVRLKRRPARDTDKPEGRDDRTALASKAGGEGKS
jgi:hypothetical protein